MLEPVKIREATVIISDLNALGNRIFHTGDTVNEDNFPGGNFDKLVKGGYIKEKGSAPKPQAQTENIGTDILKNIDLGGKKK